MFTNVVKVVLVVAFAFASVLALDAGPRRKRGALVVPMVKPA